MILRLLRAVAVALLALAAFAATGWIALALWYRVPGGETVRAMAAGGWALVALALLALARRRPAAALMLLAACLGAAGLWWQSIRPRLDRDWAPDVARTVTGTLAGTTATLENVRDFGWTSDTAAAERWETRRYDLSQLTETDLVLSYWGIDAIAHTLVSFGFADGQRVVFSVEIRREADETFSSVAGFFKTYELAFIAAEESDILFLRTNMRGEDTYLYPLDLSPQAGAALFRTYVDAANQRAATPAFYDTLTTNCTTVIFDLARLVAPGIPMDWRILLSGYLPGYLVEQDATRWKLPEEALRRRAAISARARAGAPDGADYSRTIRAGEHGAP